MGEMGEMGEMGDERVETVGAVEATGAGAPAPAQAPRSRWSPRAREAQRRRHIERGHPRVTEPQRVRVWDLYLRGWSCKHIAAEVGINHVTARRIINQSYRDMGYDRKKTLEEKLAVAVERMRLVQRQAWIDHDQEVEDAEQIAPRRSRRGRKAATNSSEQPADAMPPMVTRRGVQRALFLRIVMDAELEIARLEGLYEGLQQPSIGTILEIRRLPDGERPVNELAPVDCGGPLSRDVVAAACEAIAGHAMVDSTLGVADPAAEPMRGQVVEAETPVH